MNQFTSFLLPFHMLIKLSDNLIRNSKRPDDYLLQLDRDAEDTFNRLVNQIAAREGITEQLKANNQMEWVRRMNNIRSRVTEIVNHDTIYN